MNTTLVNHLLETGDPAPQTELTVRPGLLQFDYACLSRHRPDAHWVARDDEGLVAGRCSLWWKDTPPHHGDRIGVIGHYAADGAEIGYQLLEHACGELRANGCTRAVGPMDGNTWRNYRFVTESHGAPPFFLEPANPPECPLQFTGSGFTPLANYYSSVDEHLDQNDDVQTVRASERMNETGVTLRSLDMERFAEELRSIHEVVIASFRGGFLYQPISEEDFVAQYESIRPHVLPQLVTIAMHEGCPVGFVFAVPDLLQARAGKSIDTAIIKTLAVLPGRQFAGLGSYLTAAARRAARSLGYVRLIHALMHEANASRLIRAEYTSIIRGYTLFSRTL